MRSVFTVLSTEMEQSVFRVGKTRRLHRLGLLNGLVPKGAADPSAMMLGIGEFMLRHADDTDVQQRGLRAIPFLGMFIGKIWWPTTQLTAYELTDFDKLDSTSRVDVSSVVAALVCGWERHWDNDFIDKVSPGRDFLTFVLDHLVNPMNTDGPFVVGWWSQPGSPDRVPLALRPATIVSALAESIVVGDPRTAPPLLSEASCSSLARSTQAADWCGPHADV